MLQEGDQVCRTLPQEGNHRTVRAKVSIATTTTTATPAGAWTVLVVQKGANGKYVPPVESSPQLSRNTFGVLTEKQKFLDRSSSVLAQRTGVLACKTS